MTKPAVKKRPPVQTIDQRIAAALVDADIVSAELEKLIQQTEAATAKAQAALEFERKRSLDPTNIEAAKSRALVQDLEFEIARLKTALPQLQSKLQKAEASEKYQSWRARFLEALAPATNWARG